MIKRSLVAVAAAVALSLKKLFERGDLLVGILLVFDLLEGKLRVEKLGVNRVWGLEALADDEDLGRLSTRGLRL